MQFVRFSFFARAVGVLALASTLTACGPTYQIAKPDAASGLFPTSVEVKPDEIVVYKPSARVRDLKFFVLDARNGGKFTQEYAAFLRSMLVEAGFGEIITTQDLTQRVLNSSLRDTVGNVTDPVALAKLSDSIGPFMMIRTVQLFHGDAWFETVLTITDATTAEPLLQIQRIRLNWANLDKEVNYPVLNVAKKWLDESRALPPS